MLKWLTTLISPPAEPVLVYEGHNSHIATFTARYVTSIFDCIGFKIGELKPGQSLRVYTVSLISTQTKDIYQIQGNVWSEKWHAAYICTRWQDSNGQDVHCGYFS